MKIKTLASELSEKKEKLSEVFLNSGEESFNKNLSELYDEYFVKSLEYILENSTLFTNPFALVALGGYGRQEQAPHSDIDLLFLFENSPQEDEAEKIVRQILYPLWDYKFTIGYSTRTISTCIKEAKSDLFNFTSMLDSRFICGCSSLYFKFAEKFRAYISKSPKKFIEKIILQSEKRHNEYGNSEYLLEPDIKNGMGGLRDYHTIRWIGKINFNLNELKDFQYQGYLSESEYPEFIESLEFITRVRNHLHFLTKRNSDKLHFDHQLKIASRLGVIGKDGKTPVESFLGELHLRMNFLKEIVLMIQNEIGRPKKLGIKRVYKKLTKVEGLEIKNNLLGFKNSKAIIKDPSLLIEIFKVSGLKKVPLNSESKRLVHDFGYLVDDQFRKNQKNIRAFEKTLTIPYTENHPLDSMLNTGMLSYMISEFKEITNRIEYNDYHIYSVGRHSIRAVQSVQRLISDKEGLKNSDLYSSVYSEIRPKRVFLWAVFLHDIGKGQKGEDHSISGARTAKKILKRFGIKKEYIDTISFLIENHLYLVKTATRRDIFDEETIIACAVKTKTAIQLKMLYLLTLADSMATGPKAWTEWNESLVTSLFLKTLRVLENGSLSAPNAIYHLEKKAGEITSSLKKITENAEDIVAGMPPTYIFELSNSDILVHSQLYIKLLKSDRLFVMEVEKNKDSGLRRVFFCAKDRPGFFSNAAGVFTINNMDILDSRAFGWKNSIALSIFTVTAPLDTVYESEIWDKTRQDLEKALENEIDLKSAVKSRKQGFFKKNIFNSKDYVKIDNDSSSFYSIIEVHTKDYPGLLFELTNLLFRFGIDIKNAKIGTKVLQVVDVFYVSSIKEGGKLSKEKCEKLRIEILKELSKIREEDYEEN
ncbi:MAG: [protein-PII] uridylyltransferase [Desulforegulaceae bacterium]|nr:[protein-PII] uridylyltransferase [Desulforegulaceae bacterium]